MDDAKTVIADSEWWEVFGDSFGWRLHGFTGRHRASFWMTDTRTTAQISRLMRDDIVAGMLSSEESDK